VHLCPLSAQEDPCLSPSFLPSSLPKRALPDPTSLWSVAICEPVSLSYLHIHHVPTCSRSFRTSPKLGHRQVLTGPAWVSSLPIVQCPQTVQRIDVQEERKDSRCQAMWTRVVGRTQCCWAFDSLGCHGFWGDFNLSLTEEPIQ
jgi:hypothetical protein